MTAIIRFFRVALGGVSGAGEGEVAPAALVWETEAGGTWEREDATDWTLE